MSLRTQFSSFLSNEEIKPLLTQTVTLHLIRISATGSTYADALSALLAIATASTTYDAAQGPMKN